jgi:hypothetical protein
MLPFQLLLFIPLDTWMESNLLTEDTIRITSYNRSVTCSYSLGTDLRRSTRQRTHEITFVPVLI